MTEIPGGDPPICDSCNEPIVGPVIRVGVERFCKPCKEKTVMPWPKPTIEDFRLKTEGTDTCWIEGCEESQRQRGLCKKHYDKARHNGFLTEVVAQIDARSEPKAPPSKYTSPQAEIAELTVQLLEAQEELSDIRAALVAAIGESQDITPTMEKVATLAMQRDRCAGIAEEAQKALQHAQREAGAEAQAAHGAVLQVWAAELEAPLGEVPHTSTDAAVWASAQWQEYEKWWKDREYRATCAAERQAEEMGIALSSVRRLADELTAVDAALGPYLRQVAGDRCAAIRYVCCDADQIAAVDAALGSYRLEATGGNRLLAIEALTAPSGEVLLSEDGIRERYARLNEIGHAEELLKGLSEPLQGVLRAVLEAEKAKVLRVCP